MTRHELNVAFRRLARSVRPGEFYWREDSQPVRPKESGMAIEKREFDTRMDAMEEKIDGIIVLLTGNGHPEHGLIIRMDRIEQDRKRVAKLLWTVIGSSLTIICGAVWHLMIK